MHETIILASASKARAEMLRGAGIDFEIRPAGLDEAALRDQGAQALADAKALQIARQNSGALVIGADQILTLDGEILSKARDKEEARTKLQKLKGKTHHLTAAISVAQGETILWQACDRATLTMRDFDDEFLERYMKRAGEALTASVGAYWLEDVGAWLFEKIEGDYFTILGMPLLPLLQFLRERGAGP